MNATTQHELAVMGRSGDTKTIWNPRNAAEVEVARATFDSLKGKGFAMFKVDEDGEQGEQMRTFDPKAAKMIAVPPIAAG